jgi:hypothetical protein
MNDQPIDTKERPVGAGEIRHTVNLPFGFQATFIWSQPGGTKVEWNGHCVLCKPMF